MLQGVEEGSNEERTRSSITNSLKTKLATLMQEFTSLRNNITNHYRDVVDRRYEIVTGEKASDDQLDQLIETGEAENLFQKAILSQGRGKVCLSFSPCALARALAIQSARGTVCAALPRPNSSRFAAVMRTTCHAVRLVT